MVHPGESGSVCDPVVTFTGRVMSLPPGWLAKRVPGASRCIMVARSDIGSGRVTGTPRG